MSEEGLEWKRAVVALDGSRCVVHDDPADCELPLVAHHSVYQKHLRGYGFHDRIWDWRGGVTVCQSAHRRQHSGRETIPRNRLPVRCVTFIRETVGGWYLDRYYPEESTI